MNLNVAALEEFLIKQGDDEMIKIENDGCMIIKGGDIFMVNLPTQDPGVPNQLWNDGGVLTISPSQPSPPGPI